MTKDAADQWLCSNDQRRATDGNPSGTKHRIRSDLIPIKSFLPLHTLVFQCPALLLRPTGISSLPSHPNNRPSFLRQSHGTKASVLPVIVENCSFKLRRWIQVILTFAHHHICYLYITDLFLFNGSAYSFYSDHSACLDHFCSSLLIIIIILSLWNSDQIYPDHAHPSHLPKVTRCPALCTGNALSAPPPPLSHPPALCRQTLRINGRRWRCWQRPTT